MEKVLGFRIQLEGNKELFIDLDKANEKVENFGEALDKIAKKSSAFDKIIKKAETLEKRLKKLNDQIDRAAGKKSSSGGGNNNSGGNNNKKPSENTTKSAAQLKREIVELKKQGKEYDSLLKDLAAIENLQSEIREELKQQQIELKEGKLTVAELRKEYARLNEEGQDTSEITRQLGKAKQEASDLNAEIRRSQREFQIAVEEAGSYKQINAQLVNLRDTFRSLSKENREGAQGETILKQIREADIELKRLDAQMGIYTRNVGNYRSAFDGFATAITRTAAVLGIALGAEEIIEANVRISDAIADVAKTSNQTTEEVGELAESLKFRDTRTSLEEQLKIGEVGGRLGLAKEELEGFISSIDIANVALGDQFGGSAEEVTDTLAGLRNVLFNIKTDNVGNDILNIGNALNVLETQGNATAPVIADFVARIGGVAVPLDASAASIFGIATTLDELEVTAERGGTAVANLLTSLAATPDQYATLVQEAGLIETTEEFQKLVQTDIVSALALVSKAAVSSSETNTEFARTLASIGLNGSRVQEVFSKLGGAYDTYIERTTTAEAALQSQDSLLDEFEKKNNNLAAAVDKLRNSFINLTVNSGVQDFFAAGITSVSKFILSLASLPKFLNENKVIILGLVIALISFNQAAIAASIATLRKTAAEKIAAVSARALTIQQWLLNAAMTANPVGLVVAGFVLLVGILIKAYQNSETFRKVVDRLALPLRVIFGLITQGTGYFKTFNKELGVFVVEAVEYFNQLVLKAKRFGLQIKEALTINGDTKARIRQDIKEIEDDIVASEERVKQAKLKALNERLLAETLAVRKRAEKARAEDDARRKKAQEDEKKSEQEKLNIRRLSDKELERLAEGEDKRLAKLARKEIKRRKEVAKAAQKAAEDRLKAARKIAELEIALISNKFDREAAKAQNDSRNSIASLVGDPEQIKKQTELINKQLDLQLADIEKRRQKAKEDAVRIINELNEEVRKTQVATGQSEAESELSFLERSFSFNEQVIQQNLEKAKSVLRQQFIEGEITRKEFNDKTKEIERSTAEELLALQTEFAAESIKLDGNLAEERIKKLQTDFEIEKAELQRQKQERDKLINEDFEEGNLTEDERDAALQESEDLFIEEEIQKTQEVENAKAEVILDTAENVLAQKEALAEREVALETDKVNKILALEKRKERIMVQSNEALGRAIGNFFTSQERSFKEFSKQILIIALEAVEKQALLSIANATTREIGSKGFIGIGTAAILTGLIKGATAGLKAQINSFEQGGDATGFRVSGKGIPSGSGPVIGKTHHDQGISVLSGSNLQEWENQEYKIQNGSETYVINRRNSLRFRPQLAKLSKNPRRYSPTRRMLASAINSWGGNGVSFQEGGIASPLSVNPLNAPQIDLNGGSSLEIALLKQQNTLLLEAIKANDRKTDAVNRRIDRLRVLNDPLDALEKGLELRDSENESDL